MDIGSLYCLVFEEYEDSQGLMRRRFGKYGKDPTVETGFLPDRLGFLSSHIWLYFSSLDVEHVHRMFFWPYMIPYAMLFDPLLIFGLWSLKHTLTVRERRRNKLSANGYENSGFLSKSKLKVSCEVFHAFMLFNFIPSGILFKCFLLVVF